MKDEGKRSLDPDTSGMKADKAQAPAPSPSSFIPEGSGSRDLHPSSFLRYGFTVTELLVVIGIIILALALAVPALNLITGNKSTEAATNMISAMLARARDDAIGLQRIRGVMFYIDPAVDPQRISMAIVEQVDAPTTGTLTADVYLDLAIDSDRNTSAPPYIPLDSLPLPKGVSLQTIDSCDYDTSTPPQRKDDGYIGFNQAMTSSISGNPTTEARYGGVILFDSHGQVVSKSYALMISSSYNATFYYTPMAYLMIPTKVRISPTPSAVEAYTPGPSSPTLPLRSQVGFVLFDTEAFNNQGFSPIDAQLDNSLGTYKTGSSNDEYSEELWLDSNAVPLLINRYNGTLVKGE